MHNELKSMAEFILRNATNYQWSLQGLGMFRLYLPGNARLHLWNQQYAFSGVSGIHDHLQWKSLRSTVIAGWIENTAYAKVPVEDESGVTHMMGTFKTDGSGRMVGGAEVVGLKRLGSQMYRAGESYSQLGHVIHYTHPAEGAVTIIHREPEKHDLARIFWPAGTEWGSAVPRPATTEEIRAAVAQSLQRWFTK